jgi:hypothetical protein
MPAWEPYLDVTRETGQADACPVGNRVMEWAPGGPDLPRWIGGPVGPDENQGARRRDEDGGREVGRAPDSGGQLLPLFPERRDDDSGQKTDDEEGPDGMDPGPAKASLAGGPVRAGGIGLGSFECLRHGYSCRREIPRSRSSPAAPGGSERNGSGSAVRRRSGGEEGKVPGGIGQGAEVGLETGSPKPDASDCLIVGSGMERPELAEPAVDRTAEMERRLKPGGRQGPVEDGGLDFPEPHLAGGPVLGHWRRQRTGEERREQ